VGMTLLHLTVPRQPTEHGRSVSGKTAACW
jgi:hypothetical protein